jgi:tetratricopeptide (TPR) repeat protein
MDSFEELRLATVRELADSMRAAKRHWDSELRGRVDARHRPKTVPYANPLPAIFLIGAGCSVTAGVKPTIAMAKDLILDAAEDLGGPKKKTPIQSYEWLHRKRGDVWRLPRQTRAALVDWPTVYDQLFNQLYAPPDHQRRIFAEYTNLAETGLNWAHLCLGELVRSRYVSTVLSTNFDQLALEGMIAANVFPVICDGFETLDRLEPAPSTPQLVQIHGSRHAYRLRNHTADIADGSHDARVRDSLGALLQAARIFVAVGYGGRETGFMSSLVSAAKNYPDKALYWTIRSDDPAALAGQPRALLSTSRNARLLIGKDADTFFAELLRELGLEAPQLIREPLTMLLDQRERIRRAIRFPPVTEYCVRAFKEDLDILKKRIDEFHETRERRALRTAHTELAFGHGQKAFNAIRKYIQRGGPWTESITDAFVQILAYHIADLRKDTRWAIERMKSILRKKKAAAEAVFIVLEAATGERQLQLRDESGPYVELLRLVVEKYYDKKAPLRWASKKRAVPLRNLGIALKTVGKIKRDRSMLWKSYRCFNAALKPGLQMEKPLEWANVMQNRGAVYHIIGTGNRRAWGKKKTLVEKAVEDYETALEERKRARQPQLWARLKNSLGNARRWLGENGDKDAKEWHLEHAIAAYKEVLQLPLHERGASDRVQTLSFLGEAWKLLGDVRKSNDEDGGHDEYIEARVAYEEAKSLFSKISILKRRRELTDSRKLTDDGLKTVRKMLAPSPKTKRGLSPQKKPRAKAARERTARKRKARA